MKKKVFSTKGKRPASDLSPQQMTIDAASKKVVFPDRSTIKVRDRLDVEMFRYRLEFEAGDSFAALEAFVKAFQEKAYPPLWTIDWIAQGLIDFRNNRFQRVCQSKNKPKKKTLDEALGLNSRNRLTDGEKDLIKEKDVKIFMMVSSLMALGDAPKEACLRVSKMMNQQGLSHTWRTVRKIYREYQRIYPDYLETCKKQCWTWTNTDKKAFLSHFPPL